MSENQDRKSYLVTYTIEVDAYSRQDAAAEAYAVISEPGYWDTPPTLGVRDLSEGDEIVIDLVPPGSPLGRMLHPNQDN
jgi:hypothetical protein